MKINEVIPLIAALAYAARGWHVILVPFDTKRSFKAARFSGGVNWGATTDQDQIRRDFKKWPAAGVGIVCGIESGVWVLDIDAPEAHEGKDGIGNLSRLEAEHGSLP